MLIALMNTTFIRLGQQDKQYSVGSTNWTLGYEWGTEGEFTKREFTGGVGGAGKSLWSNTIYEKK